MQHYRPQLRHVATLPWKINNEFFVDVEGDANKLHF